jgi:hypothetical protein
MAQVRDQKRGIMNKRIGMAMGLLGLSILGYLAAPLALAVLALGTGS